MDDFFRVVGTTEHKQRAYGLKPALETLIESYELEEFGQRASHESGDSHLDLDSHDEPEHKRRRVTYSCDVCGRSFTENRSRLRHQRAVAACRPVDAPQQGHICPAPFCGQVFTRKDVCNRHFKEQHQGARRPTAGEPRSNAQSGSPHTNISSNQDSAATATSARSLGPDDVRYPPAATAPVTDTFSSTRQVQDLQSSTFAELTCMSSDHDLVMPDAAYGSTEESSLPGSSGRASSSTTLSPASSNASTSATSTSTVCDAGRSQGDQVSVVSTTASTLWAGRLTLPFRTKSFERLGASKKDEMPNFVCALCHKRTGNSMAEIKGHIGRHIVEMKDQLECVECKITFARPADLERHQQTASSGHCGFSFEHLYECTGHHPPEEADDIFRDPDHVRLDGQLSQWQQAQIHVFLHQVDSHVRLDKAASEDDRWSVIGMVRRAHLSFTSLAKSNGMRTSPDYPYAGRMLGRYQNPLTKMRARRNKAPPTPGQLLTRAVDDLDCERVKKLIRDGAPADLTGPDGSLLDKVIKAGNRRLAMLLHHRGGDDIAQSLHPRGDTRFMLEFTAKPYADMVKVLFAHDVRSTADERGTPIPDKGLGIVIASYIEGGTDDLRRMLQQLLDTSADPNASVFTTSGIGLVEFAMALMDTKSPELLLKAGARMPDENSLAHSLGRFFLEGGWDIAGIAGLIKVLLSHGLDPKLLMIFKHENEHVVKISLLRSSLEGMRRCIDVGLCVVPMLNTVELLVRAGADSSLRGEDGTALMHVQAVRDKLLRHESTETKRSLVEDDAKCQIDDLERLDRLIRALTHQMHGKDLGEHPCYRYETRVEEMTVSKLVNGFTSRITCHKVGAVVKEQTPADVVSRSDTSSALGHKTSLARSRWLDEMCKKRLPKERRKQRLDESGAVAEVQTPENVDSSLDDPWQLLDETSPDNGKDSDDESGLDDGTSLDNGSSFGAGPLLVDTPKDRSRKEHLQRVRPNYTWKRLMHRKDPGAMPTDQYQTLGKETNSGEQNRDVFQILCLEFGAVVQAQTSENAGSSFENPTRLDDDQVG